MTRTLTYTRLLARIVCAAVLTVALSASAANARILHGNPRANCTPNEFDNELANIDRCRAREGVGPLILPSNYNRLTAAERMLVVIDLDRVNRGLAPIIGLSPALNALAAVGARRAADPAFPQGGFTRAGGIWAGTPDVLESDFGWMYEDGYGRNGWNLACPAPGSAGCWGHRENILMSGAGLVGGGAYAFRHGTGSYAFEMLAGYRATLSFTWARELRSFAHRPGYEPLARPVLGTITPAAAVVATRARVTVTGRGLLSVTQFWAGPVRATGVSCISETRCTMTFPGYSKPGAVPVVAVGDAGRSRQALRFDYLLPSPPTAVISSVPRRPL